MNFTSAIKLLWGTFLINNYLRSRRSNSKDNGKLSHYSILVKSPQKNSFEQNPLWYHKLYPNFFSNIIVKLMVPAPYSAVVQCSHTVQSYSAVIQCSHTVHSYSAVIQCSHTVQSYSAVVESLAVHYYEDIIHCSFTFH